MNESTCKRPGAGIADRLASLSSGKKALLARRVRPRRPAVHELIGSGLARIGISHLYTICGTPVHEVARSCAIAGIRVIGVHHQTAAVQMACAHNYLAGSMVAAVVVSAGPAVTNTLTGILVARDNCWPVMVLGGRRPLRGAGSGFFQELDAVPLMTPVTKWASTLGSPEDLCNTLVRAARTAVSGRPGPVYIDLPEDVIRAPADEAPWPAEELDPKPMVDPGSADIERAAALLVNARRPLLILGKGARWSAAYDKIASLVDLLGMPFVTSPMGRGLISDHHPLCLNTVSSRAQSEADVVLVVGARLDYIFRFGGEIDADAKIIRVDVDRKELDRNRRAEVQLKGDAARCVELLLGAVGDHLEASGRAVESQWPDQMAEPLGVARRRIRELEQSEARPMLPHRLLSEVRHAVPDDTLLIVDGNVTMMSAEESLPAKAPLTRMTAAHNGCMGVGIPFAIAAKLENPARPVVVVSGDFAFGLAALELETATRMGLPIVVVIANNGGATGHLKEAAVYADPVTTYVPHARYESISQAFGGDGQAIEDPAEIGPALQRALSASVPVCLNVRTDPNAPLPAR